MDMRGIVPDADPPCWLGYIEVDDIDRCVATIEATGGKIVRQRFDVPNVGRIAIVVDSTGAFLECITSER